MVWLVLELPDTFILEVGDEFGLDVLGALGLVRLFSGEGSGKLAVS